MERDDPKAPKQAEAKRDGVVNSHNYKFQSILTRKILMLSNAMNQPQSTADLFIDPFWCDQFVHVFIEQPSYTHQKSFYHNS